MLILALESATTTVGAALVADDSVLAEQVHDAPRQQTETLHPLIESVLRAASVSVDDLGAVAVDLGPGLFTGLRVGVGAAKALAFARRVPLVGCTSTEALVLDALVHRPRRPVLAIVDVRRSEVAFATSEEPANPTLCAPEALTELLAGRSDLEGATLCGDGAVRYVEALGPLSDKLGLVLAEGVGAPSPAAVGRLGARALASGRTLDPLRAAPVYLRAPDARIGWATRPVAR